MPRISKSAKLYQERRQPEIRVTLRGPGPYVDLNKNPVHTLNLEPPFPTSERGIYGFIGGSSPDSARTAVWPFGDKYAT